MRFEEHRNNNIYIIKSFGKDTNLVKIGYSDDMVKRLTTYFYHNPLTEIIETCFIEKGLEWEKDFHYKHKSMIMNEWYSEDLLSEIFKSLKAKGVDFSKADKLKHIKTLLNKEHIDIQNDKLWILDKLIFQEYTFNELKDIFEEDFIQRGMEFNGYKLKDYFPPFEKVRKTKK